MFVTLVLGFIHPATGALKLASGGHEPPLLLGQQPEYLRFEGGPVLGLVDDAEFPVEVRTLEENQTLLLYSDGITDALNRAEEAFGEKRLQDACSGKIASSSQLVETIKQQLDNFVGQTEQFDDMTLLAIKRKTEGNS